MEIKPAGIFLLCFLFCFGWGCGKAGDGGVVVVYTSVDLVYAESILREFERRTGIDVRIVPDTEASKTTGLYNRLIAEKDNPQADVFWNSEMSRTVNLKAKGVLSPYDSPSGKDIPDAFKDPESFWTGFAARARVIVYNTELLQKEAVPISILDLTDPRWKNEVGMANPLFGTTASHTAAIMHLWGRRKGALFFENLKANGIKVFPGNSTVRDMVANGEIKAGLTDTDDVWAGLDQGKPLGMIYPDQEGIGTLIIPNTVALIRGARHPDQAKHLIDYLLSREVEEALAKGRPRQIPLRSGIPVPEGVLRYDQLKAMAVDLSQVAGEMERTEKFLKKLLLD
ncbi:MAG: extracellular solute-binding protein [Elusimicrobiota bacterium]